MDNRNDEALRALADRLDDLAFDLNSGALTDIAGELRTLTPRPEPAEPMGGEDVERLVDDLEHAVMERCRAYCPTDERPRPPRAVRDVLAARKALLAALSRPEPAEAMGPISRALNDAMRPGGGTGMFRVEYVDPASIRAEAMGGEEEPIIRDVALAAALSRPVAGGDGYQPVDRDEAYNRDYIPMPGGWELQTKGYGSSFRLAEPDGSRLAIPDSPYLRETLTRMASDINAAWKQLATRTREGAEGEGS